MASAISSRVLVIVSWSNIRRLYSMRPYATRQATYDLRWLKCKGLILKTPHSHRYQLTPLGRRVAVLFTKTYWRVLAPGLILLDPKTYPTTSSDAAFWPRPGDSLAAPSTTLQTADFLRLEN